MEIKEGGSEIRKPNMLEKYRLEDQQIQTATKQRKQEIKGCYIPTTPPGREKRNIRGSTYGNTLN